MPDFKKIVLSTDLSPDAAAATPYAVQLARDWGGAISLVYVFEEIRYCHGFNSGGVGALWIERIEELRTEQQEQLEKLAHSIAERGKITIQPVMLKGNPVNEIVKYASQENADCIVISTHGRTGLSHLLIGSVAERVVRLAQCPVLCVKPEHIAGLAKRELVENSSARPSQA